MDKIELVSIGDLMICDSPLYASVGVTSRYKDKISDLFEYCKRDFQNADIAIGNLETVVYVPKDGSVKEIQMCCSESTIKILRETGFSILNLSNNHCMQHGVDGFNSTVNACINNGIQPIGVLDEEPYIIEIKGMKLAFLALCIHLEWYEPDKIHYENRIEKVLNTVSELRKNDSGQIIIVSAHWGDEFATHPSNAVIQLAHKLVDLGADVILGHHPHIYQGIEEYKGAVISYSQGNFISDMVPQMCRQTGILKIILSKEYGISYKFLPYLIGEDLIPKFKSDGWFECRQNELNEALSGTLSDGDYWRMVSHNHKYCHNAFKAFFKKNIGKYRLRVSMRMLWEFMGRKLKRLLGMSTDGRVSSMDKDILKAVNNT